MDMVRLANLLRSIKGAAAVEYGPIAALIVIACVAGMSALGGGLNNQWNKVNTSM
jgi:pilus assembly protein Flp/PilA